MPRRQGHANGVTFIIIVYQLRSRRWRDPTKNGIYAGYLLKKNILVIGIGAKTL
jgi:hypothetical protein